uniref:YqzN/YkzM domain-containing protein n=1 Tax=Dulem virus 37 TaxID=3145755 RepID=A0AAU8AXF5_9CAUD
MATKKTTAAETEAVNEQAEVKAEKVFALGVLQKHCRALFGVPTVVFVGATAGLDASKKYAVSEIKDIITKWCNKEVK